VAGLDRRAWREWVEVRFVRVVRKVDARTFAVRRVSLEVERGRDRWQVTDLGRNLSLTKG
jgi:hypothetical protein